MYHFVAEPTAELRLSDNLLVGNQTTQYLKCFQLQAVRFLHDRLAKQEFCILNDESGLGKTASVVALLSALGTSRKTLVLLQNDDQLLAGWQFHLGILSDLPVCVLKDVNDSTESAHSVYLSKWSILRSIGDLSKLKFDYIIVDHRGYTLNNSFCTSMLLKQYEGKVNIVISSVDITSDVKLLYNVLRLGGCLEHQYESFQAFERRFHLPDVKEVLSKRVDLEEYYKQRGVLGEYIKDYRLRRYRHQFESYLPLVTAEQYKLNLSLWLSENNSNSTISQTTIESSSEALSTGGTDEIFECLMSMKREREREQTNGTENAEKMSESSDEVVAMEPLILQMSESEIEQGEEPVAATSKSNSDVVTISSDDCEIVTPPNTPPARLPSTSPATRRKRKFTKRLQHSANSDLTESETEVEEVSPSRSKRKSLNVRLCRVKVSPKDLQGVAVTPKKTEPKKAPLRKPEVKKPVEQTTKTPSNEITTSKSTRTLQPGSEGPSTSSKSEGEIKKSAEISTKQSQQQKSKQTVQNVNIAPEKKGDQASTSKSTQSRKSDSNNTTDHAFKKPQEQHTTTKTVSKTPQEEAKSSSKSMQLRQPATAASKTQAAETKSAPLKKPEPKTPSKTTSKTAQEEAVTTKPTQATPKKLTETTAKKPQPEKTPLKSKQLAMEQKTTSKPKQAMSNEPSTSKKTSPERQKKPPSPKLTTPKPEKYETPRSEPKTRRSCLREKNSDEVEVRQTRGMQRLTRSAESRIQSKYMLPLKALEYDKKNTAKTKRGQDANQTPKSSKRKRVENSVKDEHTTVKPTSPATTEDDAKPKRKPGRPPKKQYWGNLKKAEVTQKVATPELLSSGSVASDYSYLQCGQKLPDNLNELDCFQDFRVPEVPPATPLMLPSSLSLNLFSDSEVIVVPNSLPKPEVVVINSSNEDQSQQSTTQSRRTRALKRKVSNTTKEQSQPRASTSSFGLLLAEQRARADKSPDIFSNCSDLSQITLAQPVPPASPFEGFKIFGSEVKQQHQVKSQQAMGMQKKRERSCLDILENMFEPHKTKTNKCGINLLPMLPSPKKEQHPQRRFTLLDEDIFEITNNGEFGSQLRINATGNVSPVPQPQQQQTPQQQRNKITKYLIGSGSTPEDSAQRIQALSQAQRKSPKSIKSTQSTKLTRWFGTNADATASQSAPSTPQVAADKAAAARAARSAGPTKRKQLNLFK